MLQSKTGERILTPKQKALQVNLNDKIYGSFAEIGAGQEVADWFFKAGAASGTIAKTMSAYDMAFSDAIYGAEESGRYVCEPRLVKMLQHEFVLLEERLRGLRPETCFFSLANTVTMLNFAKTNQGHGWMGLRFQLDPNKAPNTIILHVNLKDNHRHLQQEAIGVLGVNLIYGAYAHSQDINRFISSLMENLSADRIEVDMLRVAGPDFEEVDNRLVALKLVRNGMTDAAMFGPDGNVLQPSDALYRRNILALRGRFRPVTHVNLDMLETGKDLFEQEEDVNPKTTVVLAELTLNNLKVKSEGSIDEQDFLDRVDILCSLGKTVLISNYQEYYRLVEYLSKLNRGKKIGIVLGVYNLSDVFKEKFYTNLNGGILEAFGKLFGQNVKLYIYPARIPGSDDLLTCDNFQLPENLRDLYKYLLSNSKLADLEDANTDLLHIFSDQVVSMIQTGVNGWESMVPDLVAEQIKERCLFGYPCSVTDQTQAEQARQEERMQREGKLKLDK